VTAGFGRPERAMRTSAQPRTDAKPEGIAAALRTAFGAQVSVLLFRRTQRFVGRARTTPSRCSSNPTTTMSIGAMLDHARSALTRHDLAARSTLMFNIPNERAGD
jgi:hypothetical protein